MELAEIESVLCDYDLVESAVVDMRHEQLIAWVVLDRSKLSDTTPQKAVVGLKAHAVSVLAAYMVPSR